MFTIGGKNVAGIGPAQDPGPPFWTVYVSVADLDATAAKIAGAGGTVVAGPMDVLDAGRMLVAQDPVGTFVSAWQAKAHIGAQLVNEAGAFTWTELSTSDLPRARDFGVEVFGWGVEADPGSDQAAIFTVDGKAVCGAHAAGPGEPAAWSVWFHVADCDASAARAQELGGSIVMPPTDMDFGRGAVVVDPQGAAFGIGTVNEAELAG